MPRVNKELSDIILERATSEAVYLVTHKATIRSTAQKFGVSKSNVYCDLTTRLLDRSLYNQVQAILVINKKERNIRGGNATREKFSKKRRNNFL